MKCYINTCKRKDTEHCNKMCTAYALLEGIYAISSIPKAYQYEKRLIPDKLDVEAFGVIKSYTQNVVDNVNNGNSLFLYSEITGNGKTSLACKVAQIYITKTLFSEDIENKILFISVPDFLEELRTGYDDGNYEYLLSKVKNCKMVIFDDLGAEKPSEWVRERLYTIINHRVNNGLCSIYTSNKSIEELEATLGSRICSRLRQDTKIVQLLGKDRRG